MTSSFQLWRAKTRISRHFIGKNSKQPLKKERKL